MCCPVFYDSIVKFTASYSELWPSSSSLFIAPISISYTVAAAAVNARNAIAYFQSPPRSELTWLRSRTEPLLFVNQCLYRVQTKLRSAWIGLTLAAITLIYKFCCGVEGSCLLWRMYHFRTPLRQLIVHKLKQTRCSYLYKSTYVHTYISSRVIPHYLRIWRFHFCSRFWCCVYCFLLILSICGSG